MRAKTEIKTNEELFFLNFNFFKQYLTFLNVENKLLEMVFSKVFICSFILFEIFFSVAPKLQIRALKVNFVFSLSILSLNLLKSFRSP